MDVGHTVALPLSDAIVCFGCELKMLLHKCFPLHRFFPGESVKTVLAFLAKRKLLKQPWGVNRGIPGRCGLAASAASRGLATESSSSSVVALTRGSNRCAPATAAAWTADPAAARPAAAAARSPASAASL